MSDKPENSSNTSKLNTSKAEVHESPAESTIPSAEDIRKEFENFAKSRFGSKVQFFTHAMPGQPAQAESSAKSEAELKSEPEVEEKKTFDWNFDLTPKQVKSYLDRFVIKQDEAKKALAIAVCDHYNHVRACYEDPSLAEKSYSKQNILMLGPTGVGKTYLVRQIAKLIGVPFVKADATRFTETGYVGANVDDLIRDLVTQAGGDIDKAQYGIIYLDEADKLASKASQGMRDVSGRGVQFGLLKIMEESEVDLRSGNDISSQIQALMEFQSKGKVSKKVINTRHILFIVSGAFTGLQEIIQKRLQQRAIGITANPIGQSEAEENFHHAVTQDFVDFGFEPEFVGRLPIRVHCEHLSAGDLFEILKDSEESILRQYEEAFKAYGIEVIFEDEALHEIARMSSNEKTGARALMTVCEKILREFKFELPSTDIKTLVINKELVQNPAQELEKLLQEAGSGRKSAMKAEVRKFEKAFAQKHHLTIHFDAKATDLICQRAENEKKEPTAVCEQILQGSEHGLNLIQKNTGQTSFQLGEDVVKNPQDTLEKWVTESYSKKPSDPSAVH